MEKTKRKVFTDQDGSKWVDLKSCQELEELLKTATITLESARKFYEDHEYLSKTPCQETGYLDPEYALAQDLEKILNKLKEGR